MEAHGSGEEMLAGLLRAGHLTSLDELPDLVAEQAASIGLTDPMIYIADVQQVVLRLLPGRSGSGRHPLRDELRIDSTVAGLAYRQIRPVTAEPETGERGTAEHDRVMWVPLLDGAERFGVLGITVPGAHDKPVTRRVRSLASLLAQLIASKRTHSHTYARLLRTKPMSLAAELQWALVRPLTFANEAVVISAALEPAYEVGGDTFDYETGDDQVHLAIFDAMGHDVSSALTASLATTCLRNQRYQDIDLVSASEAIHRVVRAQFGGAQFVTGILADLDIATGDLTWVNRGHPAPLVIRQGRWVNLLECEPDTPMGMPFDDPPSLCHDKLEPGDRLLLHTDGVVDARSPSGDRFGIERFIDFIIRHEADGLSTPETLRRLVHDVLRHQEGHLDDDATVLLTEWRTGRDQQLTI